MKTILFNRGLRALALAATITMIGAGVGSTAFAASFDNGLQVQSQINGANASATIDPYTDQVLHGAQ